MLNKFVKTALVTSLLVSGIQSASAENVQVNVIGTIIPAACTPTVSGGGVVDYGNIRADSLAADEFTMLPVMSLDFAINCDAPARVALHAVNDRPGTLAGSTEVAATAAGQAPVDLFGVSGNRYYAVGLGLDGTSQIGGYAMRINSDNVTADGNRVDGIKAPSADGSGGWSSSPGSVFSNAPRTVSWAQTGTLVPVAFETLAGQLEVQAYINRGSALDLSHAIHLDGQTTLEVVYL